MKLGITNVSGCGVAASRRVKLRGFNLVEVMIVSTLLVILIIATLGSIMSMQSATSRVADINSGMAVVEAKINDIRAVYYNPPIYPFTAASVLSITNQSSISLNEAGTSFLVPGTVVTKIQYLGSMGHLVTVTATFQSPKLPVTLSLQTVVNKFSGGQQ